MSRFVGKKSLEAEKRLELELASSTHHNSFAHTTDIGMGIAAAAVAGIAAAAVDTHSWEGVGS